VIAEESMSDIRAEFEKEYAKDIAKIMMQFNEQESKFEILALYVRYLEQHTVPIKDVIKMANEIIAILKSDWSEVVKLKGIETSVKDFKQKLEESDG
jgi:hypothetical protein